MAKGEISWKREDEEGERVQVYAHHVGNRWNFYRRSRRYDQWQQMPDPPLADWLELLDGVRRRAARRLIPPQEVDRLMATIRTRFPEVELEE